MSAALVAAALAWGAGLSTAALPDGRGWELASPQDKNGGDVVPMSNRTRVAADGSAVNFTSLVGFGDVQGSTIGTEYISRRTGVPGTSGWETHGISPTQKALPTIGAIFALDPSYDGEMSSDLSSGVFRAYRPITEDPNVEGTLNLYVRRDLLVPGSGTYQVATDPGVPVPTPFFPTRPWFAGASSDFSHVIFESTLNLLPDASGSDPKLYVWSNGVLRLGGILPDGSAASSSQAGRGEANRVANPHMISADGTRVFFQAPSGSGNVYMRVNGTTTVQLNASEKSARPRESPQGAVLWDASADGKRIFFSTVEGLVDGDDDGAEDYYMYDVDAPAGHHLTLVSRDGEPSVVDSGLGVIGASDDGRYLYFMMLGQLVSGEDPLVAGVYVWHDGAVRFIGSFASLSEVDFNTLNATWLLTSTSMMARVAADGSHVAFITTSDSGFRGRSGFRGYDHGTACNGSGCRELYVYSATTDQLRCASCVPSGVPPTGPVEVNTKAEAYTSDLSATSHLSRVLSSDGRWVFFNSPDPLVPEDVNGRIDAYEYDTTTGRVSLLSSGRSSSDSYYLESSASGRDAFFVTRGRLVGWDVDDNYDLYDARVGGGLPEPIAPAPACGGDGCQGGAATPASPDTAASRSFTGKGNASGKLSQHHVKHKRCRHGTRRVVRKSKVRCVRKRSHRARRAQRTGVSGGVQR